MRRRAFSLLEMVVLGSILALLAAAGLANLGQGRAGADTRGLAEAVAEVLRGARSRALASQSPVAVRMLTASGRPYAQALQILDGEQQARASRQISYAGEHPGAVIFQGRWPLDAGSQPQSAAQGIGARADLFDSLRWLNGDNLPCLIFAPSGQAQGNLLPIFDHEYHWVVSEGVVAQADTLQSACHPYTVSVNACGGVRVDPGVCAGSAVDLANRSVAVDCPAATPLGSAPANRPPVIGAVRLDPTPNPDNLPAASQVLVAPGQTLNLQVEATDPDGDPLSVRWSCADGSFSYSQWEPLSWDPGHQLWTAPVTWRMPERAVSGQQFLLECQVRDSHGALANSTQTARTRVAIGEQRPLLFVRWQGVDEFSAYMLTWGGRLFLPPGSVPQLFRANLDGSGSQMVHDQAALPEFPILSPDGKRICYADFSDRTYHIVNLDGSGDRAILPGEVAANDDYNACWSPDGAYLAIANGPDLLVLNVDSPDRQHTVVWTCPRGLRLPVWSPDANRLLFCSEQDSPGLQQIYQIDLTRQPRVAVNLTHANCWNTRPAYSPDGTHIAFGVGDGRGHVALMETDGSHRHNVWDAPGDTTCSGCWSADGNYLTCRDSIDWWVIPVDRTTWSGGTPRRITDNTVLHHSYAGSWSCGTYPGPENRVVVSSDLDDSYSLYSYRPDGSGRVRITRAPSAHDLPNGLCGPQHSWW